MNAICDECGAPLEGRVTKGGIVVCRFCRTGHDVQKLAQQRGRALIAAADFSGPVIGGWNAGSAWKQALRLVREPLGGDPPAWSITQDRDPRTHPLFWAPGSFDDFDVAVAVR